MEKRRFEYIGGTSCKYWEVHVDDVSVIVHFGRIGTDGQHDCNLFDRYEDAVKHMNKKIAEKLKKGYVEVGTRDYWKSKIA